MNGGVRNGPVVNSGGILAREGTIRSIYPTGALSTNSVVVKPAPSNFAQSQVNDSGLLKSKVTRNSRIVSRTILIFRLSRTAPTKRRSARKVNGINISSGWRNVFF